MITVYRRTRSLEHFFVSSQVVQSPFLIITLVKLEGWYICALFLGNYFSLILVNNGCSVDKNVHPGNLSFKYSNTSTAVVIFTHCCNRIGGFEVSMTHKLIVYQPTLTLTSNSEHISFISVYYLGIICNQLENVVGKY